MFDTHCSNLQNVALLWVILAAWSWFSPTTATSMKTPKHTTNPAAFANTFVPRSLGQYGRSLTKDPITHKDATLCFGSGASFRALNDATTTDFVKRGRVASDSGDYARAMACFRSGTKLSSATKSWEAWFLLGRETLLWTNDPAAAKVHFETAISVVDKKESYVLPYIRVCLDVTLVDLGEPSQTTSDEELPATNGPRGESFTKLWRPHIIVCNMLLGEALAKRGLYADAVIAYRRWLRADGGSKPALAAVGIALGHAGEVFDGLSHLERALNVNILTKGHTEHTNTRRNDNNANTNNPYWYYSAGVMAQRAGRVSTAENAFRYAVRLAPGNRVYLCGLASVLQSSGRAYEAWMLFASFIQSTHALRKSAMESNGAPLIDPFLTIAYARAQSRAGFADAALTSLSLVIKKAPWLCSAKVDYAERLLRTGRTAEEQLLGSTMITQATRCCDDAHTTDDQQGPVVAAMRAAFQADIGATEDGDGVASVGWSALGQHEVTRIVCDADVDYSVLSVLGAANALSSFGWASASNNGRDGASGDSVSATLTQAITDWDQHATAASDTTMIQPPYVHPFLSLYAPLTIAQSAAVAKQHCQYYQRRSSQTKTRPFTAPPIVTGATSKDAPDSYGPGQWSHPQRKLSIGYISGGWRRSAFTLDQAVVIRGHDSNTVDVTCFSTLVSDGSAERQNLEDACMTHDRRHSNGNHHHDPIVGSTFVDLSKQSDSAAASTIRDTRVNVLIDLSGHLDDGRVVEILLHRPAPLIFSFKGFQGTLSCPEAAQYQISDRTVSPPELAHFYTERRLYMPSPFTLYHLGHVETMPTLQAAAFNTLPRHAEHPPAAVTEAQFVFVCFNQLYKIDEKILTTWLRILARVPRSVIWLVAHRSDVATPIKKYAQRFGVDSDRIVFSPKMPQATHLYTKSRGHLFLDTPAFNGHGTVGDSLWTGVNVLTLPREKQASRVAAAISLAMTERSPHYGTGPVAAPIIARDYKDYEEIAVRFALSLQRFISQERISGSRADADNAGAGAGVGADIDEWAARARSSLNDLDLPHSALFDTVAWTRAFESTIRLSLDCVTMAGGTFYHIIPSTTILR